MFGLLDESVGMADAPWWKMGGSVVAHAAVILLVGQAAWWFTMKTPPAGGADGSRVLLLSAPGKPAVTGQKQAKAIRRPKTPPKVELAMPTPPLDVAATTAPLSKRPDDNEGNNALGGGNVNISFVQAFPAQKPDLSKLPVGSSGDVVVDVMIDDKGKVSDAKAKKGMGYGIDEMVIATVEHWVFYPAVRDGRPVESEQRLHFHYDRGRGLNACGWECFQLAER
jgi:protein TonB